MKMKTQGCGLSRHLGLNSLACPNRSFRLHTWRPRLKRLRVLGFSRNYKALVLNAGRLQRHFDRVWLYRVTGSADALLLCSSVLPLKRACFLQFLNEANNHKVEVTQVKVSADCAWLVRLVLEEVSPETVHDY